MVVYYKYLIKDLAGLVDSYIPSVDYVILHNTPVDDTYFIRNLRAIFTQACRYNHYNIVKKCLKYKDYRKNLKDKKAIAFLYACATGNWKLIRFLEKKGFEHEYGVIGASRSGDLSLVKYLFHKGHNTSRIWAVKHAEMTGNKHIEEYLNFVR